MTKLTEQQLSILERSLFLPMTQTILTRDYDAIHCGSFKVKKPYLVRIEVAQRLLQDELYEIKKEMRKTNMKAFECERDTFFTAYTMIAGGYEEEHRYYNLRIKQIVEEQMNDLLHRASIRLAADEAVASVSKVEHELALRQNTCAPSP
ncbi:MAG: hypothetical protein ACRC5C_00950 [Bacilli bacterium]